MDPVVHFEIPYDNRDRIAKFYQAAFGRELHTERNRLSMLQPSPGM